LLEIYGQIYVRDVDVFQTNGTFAAGTVKMDMSMRMFSFVGIVVVVAVGKTLQAGFIRYFMDQSTLQESGPSFFSRSE
jgi:hypothetical protein